MLVQMTIAVIVPDGQHAGVCMRRPMPAVLNPLVQDRTEANRPGEGKAQGQVAADELVKAFHSFVSVCHTYSLKK